MSDKMKLMLGLGVLIGVFGLCGLGVYRGEVSLSAALATAMAALSSAGVLSKIVR